MDEWLRLPILSIDFIAGMCLIFQHIILNTDTINVTFYLLLLTLPKYLSSNSTYRWMISNVNSSLSFCSIAQQKYKLAYLFENGNEIDNTCFQSTTSKNEITACKRFYSPSIREMSTFLVFCGAIRR